MQEIYTDIIDDPVHSMRSDLDRAELFELADNIKQNGLINPITVRPVGTRFEVVAGHRRLSACKIAGIIKITCVVRTLTDKEVFAIKAAENLERADVNPVDEATFISEYIIQTNLTIPEVAKTLRRSIGYVESRLAVGGMPDYMKNYLKTGELKLGSALALAKIDDDKLRHHWVEMAVRDGISVPQAELWLHHYEANKLPGGNLSDEGLAIIDSGPAPVVMFECAIDGKKYDARLFRTVMIYEENLPIFNAFVFEYSKPADSDSTPPAGN